MTTETADRGGILAPLTHPPDYGVWLDVEGERVFFPIAKTRDANYDQRCDLLEWAEGNPERQETLIKLCSQKSVESFLYWLNLFGYTYLVKLVRDDGVEVALDEGTRMPFITWPCQDRAAAQLLEAIWTGQSIAVNKSRDMGASWLVLAVFQWMWQFFPGTIFLEISYEEELVDDFTINSLFGKHDFLVANQPEWMVPPHERVKLAFRRLDCEGVITGAATAGRKGRGKRNTATLLDEGSSIKQLPILWTTLRATAGSRIVVSTVEGANFFWKIVRSGKVEVITLPWWDHPLKGKGAYEKKDPETGVVQIRSPWYDLQEATAIDKRETAQELGMDPSAGGKSVFSPQTVQRQVARYAREPLYVGYLASTDSDMLDEHLKACANDRSHMRWGMLDADPGSGSDWLHLWCELKQDAMGMWRPDQRKTYAIGSDVGRGTGSSNSAASIWCVDDQAKVGRIVSSRHTPDEWARMLMMAGYWFGGTRRCAFLIWEANGPGGEVWNSVRKLRYPWFYKRIVEDDINRNRSTKPGWVSNQASKANLLIAYASALSRDEFKNPDRQALDEAESYVWYDSGGGERVAGVGEREDDTTGAQAAHGDLVIADALTWYGQQQCHRHVDERTLRLPGAPDNMRIKP